MISLIQVPDLPYCLKFAKDAANGNDAWFAVIPVNRCSPRTEGGKSIPYISHNLGL